MTPGTKRERGRHLVNSRVKNMPALEREEDGNHRTGVK